MTLNHLNLAVGDPAPVVAYYTRWFGFEVVVDEPDFSKLRDAAGFELSLTPVEEPAAYPACFHLGFRQATAEAVRTLHAGMSDAGAGIRVPLREGEERVFFLALDPAGHRVEVYWES